MPNHDRCADPMCEIDRLILEDLIVRPDFQPTKIAVALQTTCMLIVLLGVGVIFAYALRHSDVVTAEMSLRGSGGGASLRLPVP